MDRYGPSNLLTFACLLCVIGSFLFVSTALASVAAISRLIVGFGSAFAFVGVLKLATIWLPPNKLAFVSGLTAALGTVGGMFGEVVLTSSMNVVGWRNTLFISAGMGIIICFAILYSIKSKASEDYVKPAEQTTFRESLVDLKSILKNRQIWLNGLFGCFVYLPTTVFAELWGNPYLAQAHHFSAV